LISSTIKARTSAVAENEKLITQEAQTVQTLVAKLSDAANAQLAFFNPGSITKTDGIGFTPKLFGIEDPNVAIAALTQPNNREGKGRAVFREKGIELGKNSDQNHQHPPHHHHHRHPHHHHQHQHRHQSDTVNGNTITSQIHWFSFFA